MSTDDIIRMANQIAGFFKAYPEETAVAETCNHIRNFWEPRMHAELFDILARGGEGLDPIALESARHLARGESRD